MALNFTNDSNFNTVSDLDLVRHYNQRAANMISNGERLIPLDVLQKYFPALFEDMMPHNGNRSTGRLNQDEATLCQTHVQPNDLSLIGSNADVNSMHNITNNAGGCLSTDENWFNEQNSSHYAIDSTDENYAPGYALNGKGDEDCCNGQAQNTSNYTIDGGTDGSWFNADANSIHITDNAGGVTDGNWFNEQVQNTSNYVNDKNTEGNWPNANANSLHMTNNAGGVTDGNWYNEQVRDASNYAIDQPAVSNLEPVQQLGYPLNYGPSSLDTGFEDLQSFSAENWTNTLALFINFLRAVQNQFGGGTVAQANQLLYGNNAWEINNDNSSTLPALNNRAALLNRIVPTWPNGAYNPVAALDHSVGIGFNLQNRFYERSSNMTSAMTTGVYPNCSSNSFYPAPTVFPDSSNSPDLTNQDPAESSTIETSSSPSPSPPPSPNPTSRFKEPDEVPGLYAQTGERLWVCTIEKCGKVLYGRRSKMRHVGTHARREERLIKAGYLEPEDAVAIHQSVYPRYLCKIPDCQYFLETGRKFYVEDSRVDSHKQLHLANYHPELLGSKLGKEKMTRNKTTRLIW